MLDWVGWVATAMFACSYFLRRPESLRRLQAVAALMWIGYGLSIGAAPVIVANMIIAVTAVLSAWRQPRLRRAQEG
jgi:hypothetical protein